MRIRVKTDGLKSITGVKNSALTLLLFFLVFLFFKMTPCFSQETSFDKAESLFYNDEFEDAYVALTALESTNDARVFHLLGELHFYGLSVNQDYKIAADNYQKAAEEDYPQSITSLGLMHEEGNFFETNLEKANELYFRAHDLGDDWATYYLAVNYNYGAGIDQNIELAIKFYEEAIKNGNESAQIDLGFLYVSGDVMEPNFEKAYELFKPLADAGVMDSQHNIGLMYELGNYVEQSYQKAFEWYFLAHEQGYAPSTFNIGEFYYNGFLKNESDYQIAANYYQQAADLEYPPAIYSLAFLWHYGEGKEKDLDKALELYIQAGKLDDPDALNALGLIYSDSENDVYDPTTFRSYFQRAHEAGSYYAALNLARSYNYYVNYSETNRDYGLSPENISENILKAREWYAKSIDIENYEGLYEYADSFSEAGNFEAGVDIILQGLKLADEMRPPDVVMTAHLYSFLAHYYELQGFGDEAQRVMKLAVKIAEENNFQPNLRAMTYRDYGATLNKNGFHQDALIYYENSEKILRDTNDRELLGPTLNGKAIVLEDLGFYEKAVETYNLAFEALSNYESDVDGTLGMIHGNIVHSLLELNRVDEALFHARKSVEINSVLLKGHPWHFRVLSDLARVHEAAKDFEAAESIHTSASELFTNRYFATRATDIDSFRFGEYHNNIHTINSVAEFFYRAYERTKSLKHLELAFYNYQKTRITRAEFEMRRLSNRLAASSNEISRKLHEYQSLSDKLDDRRWRFLQQSIFDKEDQNALSKLKTEIINFEDKRVYLNQTINLLTENTASLFSDRFLNLRQVQDQLSDQQLLVFPAETFEDESLTVFLISSKKLAVVRTSMLASELREAGNLLRTSLQFSDGSNLENLPKFDLELAHQIYKQLFSDQLPGFQGVSDLIVIPSRPISNLPLAVLITEDPTKTDYSYDEQSWLGLEKNISYLTSVSDLKLLEESKSADLFASFIGFGNPKLSQKTNKLRGLKIIDLEEGELSKSPNLNRLPSLPSTKNELKAVKAIFSKDKSRIFMQEDATEEKLKKVDLSQYNVLLFATHGVIAGEWELLDEPALVMTPPFDNVSDKNDGLLTASEIRELKLNADFVVLSACNTAAGDKNSDEGLSGLASAFIFAGAKSIIASHWSVESNATQLLITNFFKNLQNFKGIGRSEAMRQSMKKLFSDKKYNHPIFWAPFVLVGQL